MTELNGFKVLIIEDDIDTQANLCDILQLDGYETEIASSVEETLVDRNWDELFAIILDRRLPDGTADTLLPRLRDLAPRAAVIVVTGFADLDGAVADFDVGNFVIDAAVSPPPEGPDSDTVGEVACNGRAAGPGIAAVQVDV